MRSPVIFPLDLVQFIEFALESLLFQEPDYEVPQHPGDHESQEDHGMVWANCDSGAVTRFLTETDPAAVRRSGRRAPLGYRLEVRYGLVTIGSREFLLPQSAVQTARYYKTWTKAEIQFQQYRKYDANSTVQIRGDRTSAGAVTRRWPLTFANRRKHWKSAVPRKWPFLTLTRYSAAITPEKGCPFLLTTTRSYRPNILGNLPGRSCQGRAFVAQCAAPPDKATRPGGASTLRRTVCVC